MIEAIIFDLGRVLVNINFDLGILGHLGLLQPETIKKLSEDSDFVAFSTGVISPEDFYRNMCQKYFIDMEYSQFVELWCSIFSKNEGMKSIVEQLRNKYALGLLSDTDTLHWNYVIKSYPWISDYFPVPTLSFEIGYMKPEQECYVAAAASVNTSPEKCLFIDDLPNNVAGAKKLGMEGIVFSGAEDLKIQLSELQIV